MLRDSLPESAPLQQRQIESIGDNLTISIIEVDAIPQAEYDGYTGESYYFGWGLYNVTCASNRDFRLVDCGLIDDAADYIDSQMTGS